MSDEAYSNFLDKANQDTGAGKAAQKESPLKTRSVDTEVPATLQGIESYYTSEADEPWEPVSLNFEGSPLGEKEFGELIGHKGEVSELTSKEFDPTGQYKKVLAAVEKVGKETKIYRVEGTGSRVEYYIVGMDRKAGRVVGMKALAVET